MFITEREKATGFVCAMKIIEKQIIKEFAITQEIISELKIQTLSNHPNLLKIYGFFADFNNLYILLELTTEGDLFNELRAATLYRFPESKAANFIS